MSIKLKEECCDKSEGGDCHHQGNYNSHPIRKLTICIFTHNSWIAGD